MSAPLIKALPRLLSQCFSNKISLCSPKLVPMSSVSSAKISTSSRRNGLMEFFEDKELWGEATVAVGRPWRKDELRLKSNSDLHKLWYVLLKERNVIMTTEAEHQRQACLVPSPERLEKVEESMENLLEVAQERNRAFNLLETGETGEPGKRWSYNPLGMGFWKKCTEHFKPLSTWATNYHQKPWQYKYMRLYREQRLRHIRDRKRQLHGKARFTEHFLPHLRGKMAPDLSEFDSKLIDKMKGREARKD